jgi:hypothetical protein
MALIQFLAEQDLPQLLRIKAEVELVEGPRLVPSPEHLARAEAEQTPLLHHLAQPGKAIRADPVPVIPMAVAVAAAREVKAEITV